MVIYIESLTANAVVATVLGSISASSDTVAADEVVLNIVHKKKNPKKSPLKKKGRASAALYIYRASAQKRKRKLLHKNKRK